MHHVQEAGGKEADEDAGETVTQARIIAYSDSDSDDPVLPSLPFRRRRADEGSDSDNNADSSSGGSEKKGLFTWRGWNRLDKTFQVHLSGVFYKLHQGLIRWSAVFLWVKCKIFALLNREILAVTCHALVPQEGMQAVQHCRR